MDAQQNLKQKMAVPIQGPHSKPYICLRDSFVYEEEISNLITSHDSPAIKRPDRNRQTDKQCADYIESGVETCGDGLCSRTCTKPADSCWEHFHGETTSPTPAISDSVICDLCFEEFDDELTLKHHNTSVHKNHNITSNSNVILDAVSLKCTKCNFEAISREVLQNHVLLHYEKTKCFFTQFNLKTHSKTHSIKEDDKNGSLKRLSNNPYTFCRLCNFKTMYPSYLKKHLKIRHTVDKSFNCDLCHFKSTHKQGLTVHLTKHTGEKLFFCNVCDYKSSGKGNLNVHMKKHTGEKPFHCNLCDYKSSRKCNLNVHMRTHTGEKPFRCNLCDFKATDKHGLTRHLRKH